MKSLHTHLFTLLLLLAMANAMLSAAEPSSEGGGPEADRAALVQYALLVPADKTFERVKTSERNPFGKSEESGPKGNNEENTIRDLLAKLRASGASFDKNDTHIMLGDMILRPGQFVPPVIHPQSLNLRVVNIRRDSIELQWIEKKSSGAPRILTIPVDLRPVVHYQLQGQAGAAKATLAASSKNMKMGEQFVAGLSDEPPAPSKVKIGTSVRLAEEPSALVQNTAGSSNEPGGPTGIETAAIQPPSADPMPTLPTKTASTTPALAPVNLDLVSRFTPKQVNPGTASAGSGQSTGTGAK